MGRSKDWHLLTVEAPCVDRLHLLPQIAPQIAAGKLRSRRSRLAPVHSCHKAWLLLPLGPWACHSTLQRLGFLICQRRGGQQRGQRKAGMGRGWGEQWCSGRWPGSQQPPRWATKWSWVCRLLFPHLLSEQPVSCEGVGDQARLVCRVQKPRQHVTTRSHPPPCLEFWGRHDLWALPVGTGSRQATPCQPVTGRNWHLKTGSWRVMQGLWDWAGSLVSLGPAGGRE